MSKEMCRQLLSQIDGLLGDRDHDEYFMEGSAMLYN